MGQTTSCDSAYRAHREKKYGISRAVGLTVTVPIACFVAYKIWGPSNSTMPLGKRIGFTILLSFLASILEWLIRATVRPLARRFFKPEDSWLEFCKLYKENNRASCNKINNECVVGPDVVDAYDSLMQSQGDIKA